MTDLYDITEDRSSCGVGFITRKDGVQSHDVLSMGHEALCRVPHRGGMSSTGVGDGAGISVDLSLGFFSKLLGRTLAQDEFGVGNFFLPTADQPRQHAKSLIEEKLAEFGFEVLLRRKVPVNNDAIEPRGIKLQLPIRQWVFAAPEGLDGAELDQRLHDCLLAMEAAAYTDETLDGFYPLSLSTRMQVLKGRLSSWEIIPYYSDLSDSDQAVHTM
ncbi:MAG: glutamate synthase large subunit, partial [Pseudomonadota bacterium]